MAITLIYLDAQDMAALNAGKRIDAGIRDERGLQVELQVESRRRLLVFGELPRSPRQESA